MLRRSMVSMLLLLAVPAMANEPSVTVDQSGSVVVGRTLLAAPSAQVKKAIQQVSAAEMSSPSVLDVTKIRDGACEQITRKTRGVFSPLVMNTRRCPTQTGWREFLVQSDDFNAYEMNWVVREGVAGGTQVELHVKTELSLGVPQSLVNAAGVKSVRQTLEDVLRNLLAGKSE